jgi:hypothetical protein
MSQILSIFENYLVVFVCTGICFGIFPTICPTGKTNIKNNGLLEFASSPLIGGGLDANSDSL